MPFVKCATSASSSRSVRGASICIHTIRGSREAGTAIRTWPGSGAVVSIGRFDTTISSSSPLPGEVLQQMLGVVADAGPSRPERRAVKGDAHASTLSAPRRARDGEPERQREQHVDGREAKEGIDRAVHANGHDGEHHAERPRSTRSAAAAAREPRKLPRGAPDQPRRTRRRRATPLPANISRYMLLLCMRGSGIREARKAAVKQAEVVGTDAKQRMRRKHLRRRPPQPQASRPLRRTRQGGVGRPARRRGAATGPTTVAARWRASRPARC